MSSFLIARCQVNNSDTVKLSDTEFSNNPSSGADISTGGGKWTITRTSGNGSPVLSLKFKGGSMDFSKYQYLVCSVKNLSSRPQLVEMGFNDVLRSTGAAVIQPNQTRVVKAVIIKDDDSDSNQLGVDGLDGFAAKLWYKTHSDAVKGVNLTFPNMQGDGKLEVSDLRLQRVLPAGKQRFAAMATNATNTLAAPAGGTGALIDDFGQYNKGSWEGKITSAADFASAKNQENADLARNPSIPGRDQYGGWSQGPQFAATGTFGVKKYNGKWWLVDPEGKLFWSNGIDAVNTDGFTRVTGRKGLFSTDNFVSSDKRVYKTDKDGGYYNFIAANLQKKYGNGWNDSLNDITQRRLRSWGINTIGNWSDQAIYQQHKVPYVGTITNRKQGKFKMPDPFDANFETELSGIISSKFASLPNDPWCIGFFVDNELPWDAVSDILTEKPDQPAKVAFSAMLKSKYNSIGSLNGVWNTSFSSWDDLLNNTKRFPALEKNDDFKAFYTLFANTYFTKVKGVLKKEAPKKLYLGCRFHFQFYPADTTFAWVVSVAAKYCDVVSFNRYRYTAADLKPAAGADYPIIIGEFHFGSLDRGAFLPGLRYVGNQKDRGDLYSYYVSSALNNPYIVGAHWFQYYDEPLTGRSDGENFQVGFLNVGDSPYYDLINSVRKLNGQLYTIRANNK